MQDDNASLPLETKIVGETLLTIPETLRQRIISACADMEEEYLEVEREFLRADEELHRKIEK